jgi:hypothetical protein
MSYRSNQRPLAASLVVLGILGRLLPHPPNFAPVDAVCLFAGARMRRWAAFLLPLAVMTITDTALAVFFGVPYSLRGQAVVYAALMLNVVIGRSLLGTSSALRVGAAASLCSLQFFLTTNFAVWTASRIFPHTGSGLLACYVAGLPFLGRTLASDLVFSAVLFGLYGWLSRTFYAQDPALVEQR